jgi:hypothetical protein
MVAMPHKPFCFAVIFTYTGFLSALLTQFNRKPAKIHWMSLLNVEESCLWDMHIAIGKYISLSFLH